ncbi:MAG: hypothetical protein AB7G11_02740 [Phycisphaerales bacterium]
MAETITPTHVRTRAFRWLVNHLQADGALGRVVDDWQVWDGSPSDDDPLPDNRVTVRLTPVPDQEEQVTNRSEPDKSYFNAPVQVDILTRVPGSNVDDSLNLCGILHGVLLKPLTREQRRTSGISWVESVRSPAAAGDNTTASGAVRLMIGIRR